MRDRLGPLGDDQRPSDERRRLARPACLDREPAEIDVVAREHHLLHRAVADGAGLHRAHRVEQRQHLDRLAPAARRLGLTQEGQRLAHLAKLVRLPVHAPGDALHGAEEVDQHRHVETPAVLADDVLEQHRRPLLRDEAGLDLGHLQMGRDRRLDPAQASRTLQAGDEVAQRSIGHGHLGGSPPFMGTRPAPVKPARASGDDARRPMTSAPHRRPWRSRNAIPSRGRGIRSSTWTARRCPSSPSASRWRMPRVEVDGRSVKVPAVLLRQRGIVDSGAAEPAHIGPRLRRQRRARAAAAESSRPCRTGGLPGACRRGCTTSTSSMPPISRATARCRPRIEYAPGTVCEHRHHLPRRARARPHARDGVPPAHVPVRRSEQRQAGARPAAGHGCGAAATSAASAISRRRESLSPSPPSGPRGGASAPAHRRKRCETIQAMLGVPGPLDAFIQEAIDDDASQAGAHGAALRAQAQPFSYGDFAVIGAVTVSRAPARRRSRRRVRGRPGCCS